MGNYENEDIYYRQKTLRKLILLVAYTAIMLIAVTYAWFSSQKDVTLSGLKGEVNVAEGLQISLDAEHWVNTINFGDFEQKADGTWTQKASALSIYLGEGKTFQSPRGEGGGITNVTPEELLPVSTTAYSATSDGIGQTGLKFYEGTNTETVKLMDDTHLVTEGAKGGYFAFDLFIKNTSAGTTPDVLQLDPISDVIGTNEATGVQNTARVALALYNNNNNAEGFNASTATAGTDMTISGENNLSIEQIVAGTSTGKTIKDVAIWEPNADKHTETIISSRANSLKLDADELTKWTGMSAADTNTKVSTFANGVKLPTYGLTSSSLPVTKGDGSKDHILDVYDWRITDSSSTAAKGVKKQYTLQTTSYESSNLENIKRTTSVELVSTNKLEKNAGATDTTFTINASQYSKIRVYFWMEGQDPDCINAASLGGGLTLDLGFSKKCSEDNGGETGNTTTAGTYLPTGFSQVADPETDVTIQDPKGNQYVWVSVPQTLDVYPTAGLNITTFTNEECAMIEEDLHTYTSAYRLTGYTDTWYSEEQHGFTSADAYNAEKNKMLKSVYQNGGFYVGKYETGIDYSETYRTSNSGSQTPVIKQNAYVYNYVTNKQAQTLASSMNSGGYTSSLMFGVQWDLVLKYMETKGAAQSDLNNDSTSWGNYYNNQWTVNNTLAKYSTDPGDIYYTAPYAKTSHESILLTTGASSEFNKAGIYDIAGNVREWTLEYTSNTSYPYANRGGNYNDYGNFFSASAHNYYGTRNVSHIGFRVVLY